MTGHGNVGYVYNDHNPSHLHPSRTSKIVAEVVSLAGGAQALVDRARELGGMNPQLALHLVDFALRVPGMRAAPWHLSSRRTC